MAKIIKRKCKICNKEFEMLFSRFKQDSKKCNAGKFCSQKCFYKSPERSPNKNRKGEKSYGWKGGRLYERGYKLVISPKDHPYGILKGGNVKYIREHRLVMEKHIGRYLEPHEIIHHKNENKLDNRVENLEITNYQDHSRHHKNKYWKDKCDVEQGIKVF